MRTAMAWPNTALALSMVCALACGDDDGGADAAMLDGAMDAAFDSSSDTGTDGGADSGRDAIVTAPALSDLLVDRGELAPAFDVDTMDYDVSVGALIAAVRVRPSTETVGATITVNDEEVASGAFSDPIPVEVGTTTIVIVVSTDSMMATYAVDISRESPGVYVKASNSGADDIFGNSVAISGDTLVVGAPREDSVATGIDGDGSDDSAENSGAVYVFRNTGGVWAQEAYIKSSDSAAGDSFGLSVDIEGDAMIVGAGGRASGRGGAYVFRRTGSTWSEEALLEHPSADPSDNAGQAVAISGDVAVLGVHAEDGASSGIGGDPTNNALNASGAVVVFRFDGTDWLLEAFIKASNAGEADRFGLALDLDGDTLIVAALTEDSNATDVGGDETNDLAEDSGAAYIFHHDGSSWSQQAYLKAANTGPNDQFGVSVTVSGDWAAVGAFFEDSDSTGIDGDGANDDAVDAGAVYVYRRSGATWSLQSYLKASNTEAGDQFGWRCVLDGDVLAVSAYFEDSNATLLDGDQANNAANNAGAVFAFYWTGSTWQQFNYVKASNTGADDTFGFALGMSGGHLAVGARGEDSSAIGVGGDGALDDTSAAGAAYLY